MKSDRKLFIDPSLISISKDPLCVESNQVISSYFDKFYTSYRNGDTTGINELLAHAREVSDTHIGYGGTFNGSGNTAKGLMDKFSNLSSFITKINSVSLASDLPVFIRDFDKDGLSDMITNIIRLQLYNFTQKQMALYGISSNSTCSFFTWCVEKNDWDYIRNVPSYAHENGNILLVPKEIVQKNYLCRAEHFFRHVILERMQHDETYTDSLGKTIIPYKKELEAKINKQNKAWKQDFVIDYTSQFPDALSEYHKRIPEFYYNRRMTDDELDFTVYGRRILS